MTNCMRDDSTITKPFPRALKRWQPRAGTRNLKFGHLPWTGLCKESGKDNLTQMFQDNSDHLANLLSDDRCTFFPHLRLVAGQCQVDKIRPSENLMFHVIVLL